MKVKWCAYFTEFPPIYAIATILDPGVKLKGLTNLLTYYYQQLDVQFDVPYYVNNCKRILERLCEDYEAVIQPQSFGSSMGASRFRILGPVLKKSRPNVPASIIASESAFSVGRRVLDEKRSRLSSESIEMCVCKKDWDQAEKRTQGLKEEEEDEDDPWMTLDTSDSGGSGDGGNQQQQQQQPPSHKSQCQSINHDIQVRLRTTWALIP
ncbi:putative AC9 transposase [Bienertia sinuspersici]